MTNDMNSPTVSKIYEALAKAQGMMNGAKKGNTNPHLKYNYANITQVWDACREPLSENGLCVVQPMRMDTESGRIYVDTVLGHSSGEWIKCTLPIMVGEKMTSQAIGSAITYARRYGLMSMVGICPVDDDGHEAEQYAAKVESTMTKPSKAVPMPEPITKEQLDQLSVAIHTKWPDAVECQQMIATTCASKGIKSLAEMKQDDWQKAMNRLTVAQQEKLA